MARLKLYQIFFSILTIFLLVGCSDDASSSNKESEKKESENQDKAKTLKMAFYEEPATLDTHLVPSAAAAHIAANIFETLLTVDSNDNIQPMLADSWEMSDDGLSIIFHLREGIPFHNGKEMAAEDVVASMNRWIEISLYGQQVFGESKFEEIDQYTVKLVLEEPTSIALTVLAFGSGHFPAIMPKEIIDNAGPNGVQEYIGTGPFKMNEHRKDQYINLVKHQEYKPRSEKSDGSAGARLALVDEVYINFVKDPSTRIAGVMSGEYDISLNIPSNSVGQLENDPNINIHVEPSGNLELYFNKKKGVFTDKNVRQAVAAGIDYDEIMQNAFYDEKYYDLTHNVMLKRQENKWNSDNGKDLFNVHDLDKAKEFLAKSSYNGEEIVILTRRDTDAMYKSTVVLQQQLEQIGIKSKLEVVDGATYRELRTDENAYDIFPVTNVPRAEPLTSPFFAQNNLGFTDSKELEAIVAEFNSKKSIEEAIPLYDDLQAWFWDYLPIIKLGDMTNINASQKNIENFKYADSMMLYNVEVLD
ncbi:ABC transporter substrate-binding protein [Bacillus sp. JJ1532]|uniref:ABC transporter substrate-binding protein n=1 Tax=Bacillus sp. JJ1532 TaxID=3122958 RepID=UPI002FFF383D